VDGAQREDGWLRPDPADGAANVTRNATRRFAPGRIPGPRGKIKRKEIGVPRHPSFELGRRCGEHAAPRDSLVDQLATSATPARKAYPMKIWIDADAAPREMKEVVYRASSRLQVETVLVANRRLQVPPGVRFASAVRVEGGPDEADRYIAERASAGDVAITADIPLASLLVTNQVHVIDPRGESYTPENIGERLGVRDFMDAMRGAGLDTGGARPYGPKDKQKFADALDRLLTRLLRDR
jgi:uncharacterized protein